MNLPPPAPERRLPVVLFAVLHLVCCGLPLLLLSGVSLAFVLPYWPVAAIFLAVLGVIGFAWYLRRGCATCPRNEGRRCARSRACLLSRSQRKPSASAEDTQRES